MTVAEVVGPLTSENLTNFKMALFFVAKNGDFETGPTLREGRSQIHVFKRLGSGLTLATKPSSRLLSHVPLTRAL